MKRLLPVIAFAACAWGARAQVHVDPVLARMAPPGTVSLVGARMEELKSTPLYQRLIAAGKLPDLDRFTRETGFDPRRDVREILLASAGKPGDTVLLARGSFKITGFGSTKTFKHGIYAIHGDDRAGFCVLDQTTAAAGPLPVLFAALDQWHSGEPPAIAGLLKRLEALPVSTQLWALSSGGFNFPGTLTIQQGGPDFAQIFRGVRETRFFADLRAGLDATVEGEVKNGDDAKNLGDAARGLIGIGRLSVPDAHRELLKLWDGFHVEQNGTHVAIVAKVPQDQIDHLVDLVRSGEIGPPQKIR